MARTLILSPGRVLQNRGAVSFFGVGSRRAERSWNMVRATVGSASACPDAVSIAASAKALTAATEYTGLLGLLPGQPLDPVFRGTTRAASYCWRN